ADGVIRLLAQRHHWSFLHGDHLRAMDEFDAIGLGRAEMRRNLGLIADENDAEVGIGGDGLHGTGNDGTRRMIAAHRIQRDQHYDFPSSIATTSRPWYWPQLGQTRCGSTGSLHCVQY